MAAKGRRYLLTGGGTGGHVTPNMAIRAAILEREPDARFLYVGSRRGYEASRIPTHGIDFRWVRCAPFCSPRRPLAFLRMAFCIILGTIKSVGICLRYRPEVVVATGGYVSVPCVLAAWLLRRRIYLHEQNAHPGLANRALSMLATRVGVSFRESLTRFPRSKAVHVGYPVRPRINHGCPDRARERFAIEPGRRVAFILGGSMGSRSINRGTVEALETLLGKEDLAVIHVTGLMKNGSYQAYEDTRVRLEHQGIKEQIPGRYVCEPFIDRIEDVYALADLVVARAGAGTIMELAAVGKPSLLIPKSDSPGDHQLLNAMALQRAGSAEVLLEEMGEEGGNPITRVRGDALARKISGLLEQQDELARMGRRAQTIAVDDALDINAELVCRLASGAPLIERVVATDRVGFFIDAQGQTHEFLFRNNIVGSGLLPDIAIPADARRSRAIVQRIRRADNTEFYVIPRRGRVEINGVPLIERTRLNLEDRVRIGDERYTFSVRDREVERHVRREGMGLKVVATGLGTLVSRLFGFAREAITAAVFGLGSVMDLLAVGLTVSNFFRGVFAEMAVDHAFLPTFVHLNRTGRRREANRLLGSVLMLTLTATTVVCAASIVTLPLWLPTIAPGFVDRGIIGDAVRLTSILFPYLVLVSVAAVFSAVLKACDRFAAPAFSPLMFSVGVLGGVVAHVAFDLDAILALGYGVLAGGLGQVLVQLPPLLSRDVRQGYGVKLGLRMDVTSPGIRKIGRITPNILADSSIQKLGGVVDKILATPLAAGMVSAMYFALVIFRLPFGLISQSVNTVILKELSETQAVSDREAVRRLLVNGINWTVFTLLPTSIAMMIVAEPTVRLLFEYASFTPEDTKNVALALRLYSVGLVGWGLYGLCGRFFAARLEQHLATLTSLVALLINVAVSVTLVQLGFGIAGLALGTSIGFLAAAGVRLVLLARGLRIEGIPLRRDDLLPSIRQTTLATAGAAIASLVVSRAVVDFSGLPLVLNRIFVLGVPVAFGTFSFVAMAILVRSEQLDEIRARLGRRRQPATEESPEPRPINPYCLPSGRLLSWVKANPGVRLQYNFTRRVAIFLNSPDWRIRNHAIKLIQELRLTSFRYDLCNIVTCREPAPLGTRLIGGDFVQPGFLRRNAIGALLALNDVEEAIETALLAALDDPYYEVRAEAARVLGEFGERLSGPAREEAQVRLGRGTRENDFVVASAATLALSRVAVDDTMMSALKDLHYHRNWQVRDAVVRGYDVLYERGIISERRQLLALLDDVLTTSEGFIPRFVLKEHLAELQQKLLRGERRARARGTDDEREAEAS